MIAAVVEDAIWDAARRHLPARVIGGPTLTAAVVDRSRRYTSERERLAAPMRGKEADDLAARALFFTAADAPKAALVLAELGAGVAWTGDAPLRVLDLGAGVGAMTIGLLAHAAAVGATRRIVVELIDRDGDALAIARDAVSGVGKVLGLDVEVGTCTARLSGTGTGTGSGTNQIVLIGTMLNELEESEALAVVRDAMTRVAPDGALVIVEPALRAQTRALHRLRDAMLANQWAHVFAPCTRRGPCPMLLDERDWCHEDRPGGLPPRANQIAQVTGLRDGTLKYSYLVLRHVAGSVGDGAHRVVGQPQRTKGKLEALACGDDGLVTLRLLSRHRGESTRAFDRAHRGDVLAIEPPVEIIR